MVERQASLKSNLFKAEQALQHRDMARAKKYADLAEGDAMSWSDSSGTNLP